MLVLRQIIGNSTCLVTLQSSFDISITVLSVFASYDPTLNAFGHASVSLASSTISEHPVLIGIPGNCHSCTFMLSGPNGSNNKGIK